MAEIVSVETPVLTIAVEISGPEDGRPMILLHGWPDDVRPRGAPEQREGMHLGPP